MRLWAVESVREAQVHLSSAVVRGRGVDEQTLNSIQTDYSAPAIACDCFIQVLA